jgi:hypothetical protein
LELFDERVNADRHRPGRGKRAREKGRGRVAFLSNPSHKGRVAREGKGSGLPKH